MCTNYEVTSNKVRLQQFGLSLASDWHSPVGKYHVFNHYPAPIIRLNPQHDSDLELISAEFGLLPAWSKERKIKFATMNARVERVAQAPAYRQAWARRQKCIIPADWIVEPDWRSGHYQPARIARADGQPIGIAGLWDRWVDKISTEVVVSFTMLTVSAADDVFMSQFHKPGQPKRTVVMLKPEDYSVWLECPTEMNTTIVQSSGLADLTVLS
ncbi:SOS response-associated peptidase family protein [Neisseriaceae bacterium ESL0693]|nr:SOS response-associated peptidase family protein [Neisseriaceae bacterium ESL0693]